MNNALLRMGVIGLGHMGGYHARILAQLAGVQLVGVAEPNKAHWHKITQPGITLTTDYHDLLAHVDAVIIAVPTALHHPIAKDALSAGKHVLIEKPLASTTEQAEELFALAQEHNCVLHVGHVERFNSAICALKDLVHEPYLIEAHRVGPFSPRPQDDSVVLDLMIHDIDLVLGLVPSPIAFMHVIGNKIATAHDDIAVVQIKFQNGALANLTASRASEVRKRALAIHQKNAFITVDCMSQEVTLQRLDPVQPLQNITEQITVHKDNALQREIVHFITAIRTGTTMRTPEHDIQTLSVTLALDQQL